MSVKIIIRRKVPKSKEAKLLPLFLELRSKAITQPGYISGETLRNVNEPEDYVVIGTWKSVGDWKTWEKVTRVKHPEIRPRLLERIRRLLYWEKG